MAYLIQNQISVYTKKVRNIVELYLLRKNAIKSTMKFKRLNKIFDHIVMKSVHVKAPHWVQ